MNTSRTRVVLSALAVSTMAVALAGSATAAYAADKEKVSYCHATHSDSNPYVLITTSKTAVLRAHATHQMDEDIIPAFSYMMNGSTLQFAGQSPHGVNPEFFVLAGCMLEGS